MADFDCFCQFTGHTVDFTIQRLTLWPHSKWRNKCYYDNYVFLERVCPIGNIYIHVIYGTINIERYIFL